MLITIVIVAVIGITIGIYSENIMAWLDGLDDYDNF
jgi:hypothetical protein